MPPLRSVAEELRQLDHQTRSVPGIRPKPFYGLLASWLYLACTIAIPILLQLLKGGTVDEPPIIWRRILVPYESQMTSEDRYHAARLYCIQALKAGITMFADAGSMDMTGTIQAASETGIRASIARVGRDLDSELPSSMCDPNAEQALEAMEQLYKKYHGSAGGRIHIWFSLSSPMSSSPQLVEGVAMAARQRNTGIHIHLGEHPAEVQTCLSRWGLRPPAFLDQYGALGSNVIAAHCIQITDFDIRLMAERGLNVIHCPTANLPTQGIPKLLAERAAGLNIALGNDGATSAKQDMFGQVQLLKYVTQASYGTPVFEPTVLPLAEAFRMMTANGAKALGMEGESGELAEGMLDKFNVTVICVVPSYLGTIENKYKMYKYYEEEINGVKVLRIRVPEFSKTDKKSRIKNVTMYLWGAMSATFKVGKQDYVFSISQPPVLGGLLGVWGKLIKHARYIYNIQDFNPEQILAVGYIKNKIVTNLMMWLDMFSCKMSDLIITVGRDLVETVENRFKGKHIPKTVMINNWIDENKIYPLPDDHFKVTEFRKEYLEKVYKRR